MKPPGSLPAALALPSLNAAIFARDKRGGSFGTAVRQMLGCIFRCLSFWGSTRALARKRSFRSAGRKSIFVPADLITTCLVPDKPRKNERTYRSRQGFWLIFDEPHVV